MALLSCRLLSVPDVGLLSLEFARQVGIERCKHGRVCLRRRWRTRPLFPGRCRIPNPSRGPEVRESCPWFLPLTCMFAITCCQPW